MFFYLLFLRSESYYYVKVSQNEFESLLRDLSIEFNLVREFEDSSYQSCYNYYYLKNGKKKLIGYVALVKNDVASTFLPDLTNF